MDFLDEMKAVRDEEDTIKEPISLPWTEENPVVQIGTLANKSASVMSRVEADYKARVIDGDDDYHEAEADLGYVRRMRDDIEAYRKKLTAPLLTTKKNIDILFKRPLLYLEGAERIIKKALLDYQNKKKREADEATAKARAAIEEAQKESRAALVSGDYEKAQEAIDRANVAATTYIPEPELRAAAKQVTLWKHKVDDFPALVKAVSEGVYPMDFLLPNDKVLADAARSLRDTARIPGVIIYSEQTIRAPRRTS